MLNLEKRIAELEKAQPSNDGVNTIIVRLISPVFPVTSFRLCIAIQELNIGHATR